MNSPGSSTGRRAIRRLRIVIPVLNEAENVRPLVRELSDALSNYAFSILIIDDGSTDELAHHR